jgi:hypothetical protein
VQQLERIAALRDIPGKGCYTIEHDITDGSWSLLSSD